MTFAQLNRIIDPRDSLEKARQSELVAFARQNNVTEVRHDMPAILIRKILRAKRLTNIMVPPRPLGVPSGAAISDNGSAAGIDASDDLAAQYAAQKPAPTRPTSDKMSITEARRACKDRGIPFARTDKLTELMAKLNGENTA